MNIILTNHTNLIVSTNVYHPYHGPQVWPWWRLIVVHLAKSDYTQPPREDSDYLGGRNLWFYTRWGAWCWEINWPKVAA